MKKKILGALAFTLVTTSAFGANDGLFVGLDIGNTKADTSGDVSGIAEDNSNYYSESFSVEEDGSSITLKIGQYFNENNRVSGFYQKVNAEDGSVSMLGVSYDYLLGEGDLKPFIGVSLGYGSYDLDEDIDGHSVDIVGLVYGLQAGVNYEVVNNLSAEIGYRLFQSKMSDTISESFYNSGTRYDLKMDMEVNDIANWYLGVNYKF